MTHTKLMIPTDANDIIGPTQFGPSLWQGLHYITLGYPTNPTDDQKDKYKAFFLLLKDTLPCSVCANHYAENLKILQLTDKVLENKENLVKWLIDLHNIVNDKNNKEIIEYKNARTLIDTDIQCKKNIYIEKKNPIIYGIAGILFILLLMLLFKNHLK
jgi:uncharacterized membrane protein